ncbi:hypothetical protein GCM10007199_32630 [Fictibacillus barbaricus]|nr:hypothetical protein GCM10007199_32630 [Fictibacillus barbaricus]
MLAYEKMKHLLLDAGNAENTLYKLRDLLKEINCGGTVPQTAPHVYLILLSIHEGLEVRRWRDGA